MKGQPFVEDIALGQIQKQLTNCSWWVSYLNKDVCVFCTHLGADVESIVTKCWCFPVFTWEVPLDGLKATSFFSSSQWKLNNAKEVEGMLQKSVIHFLMLNIACLAFIRTMAWPRVTKCSPYDTALPLPLSNFTDLKAIDSKLIQWVWEESWSQSK